jgi:hypothetical protein
MCDAPHGGSALDGTPAQARGSDAKAPYPVPEGDCSRGHGGRFEMGRGVSLAWGVLTAHCLARCLSCGRCNHLAINVDQGSCVWRHMGCKAADPRSLAASWRHGAVDRKGLRRANLPAHTGFQTNVMRRKARWWARAAQPNSFCFAAPPPRRRRRTDALSIPGAGPGGHCEASDKGVFYFSRAEARPRRSWC